MYRISSVVVSWIVLLAVFGCSSLGVIGEGMYCAYVNHKVIAHPEIGKVVIERSDQYNGTGAIINSVSVRCKNDTEFCYTFWYIDPSDRSKALFLMQGCWDNTDGQDCTYQDCVATSAISRQTLRNTTRFCCCAGSMCNANVTDNVNFTALELQRIALENAVNELSDPTYSMRTIIASLVSVSVLAVCILIIFLVIHFCCQNGQANDPEASLFLVPPSMGLVSGQIDIDDLKLECTIHRGRYGEVYKAILNDTEVAVKSLYSSHRQYYYNERDIYLQVCMQHENIAKFCGYYERQAENDMPAQYMIVTAFVELGTLTNYLKNNTVDWQTMCRMWHSMTSGLAHLHTEVIFGGTIKPTIAHRDFNSRNILVKPDRSCCICDFGLAMKILTPRLSDSNSVDHDEHLSLADVGTLRYMAPEVLEGSVNLYDCKTSLTQVDIYSLGLVFWEVASRCHDLYQGLPTPEYRLPFELELGVHPAFEDMQVLVSRNKTRPAFPEIWKDSNLAIRSMKDTIEECWDQDPEARVSAVCVEERSREMGNMWDSWHRCMTPTANFSHLKELEDKAVVQHNLTFSRISGSMSSLTTGDIPTIQRSEPTATQCSHSSTDPRASNNSHNPTVSYPREQSASTVTIETMMTLSPSETHESSVPSTTGKPDCNLIYAKMNIMRQPHQGQNPTVERNTHKNSDEELAVEGNTLVNKQRSSASQQNGNVVNCGVLLLDAISRNTDTGALIQNDILDFQNQNMPVPNATVERQQNGRLAPTQRTQHRLTFVPNPVDAPSDQVLSESIIVRPKKQNIPTNGDIDYSVAKIAPGPDKTSRLGQLKKQFTGGKSPPVRKFSFPSFGWHGKTNEPSDVAKDGKKPGEVRHLSSEVCLIDGQTVVRPNSLALNRVCLNPKECRVSNRNLDDPVHEKLESSRILMTSEMANGYPKPSSCSDTSPSGSDVNNETSAKSSSGENFAPGLSDAAVQRLMPNGETVMHSIGTAGSAGGANKSSSLSEGSVGDNMGYEASCSPVGKIDTCLV